MTEEQEKKQQKFWQTFPGILTGMLASLTGLIVAINETGIFILFDNEPSQTDIKTSQQPNKITGKYLVYGSNPDGTNYSGTAIIRYEEGLYYIKWEIAKQQTYYGSGRLEDNLLKINWEGGLVSYVIKDDRLYGSWANGAGTETLSPITDGF